MDHEQRYRDARALLERPSITPAELDGARRDLKEIANRGTDRHLRANAAVLLGGLLDAQKRSDEALGYYRLATELVPDDAGPWWALAAALNSKGDFEAAAQAQRKTIARDPDNLEGYLAMGELYVKAGNSEEGGRAYAAYEVRRKGLLNGLTLKKDGAYVTAPAERAQCAAALSVAADAGTGRALLFALATDPDARVRQAIVETLGTQRLTDYAAPLTKALETEKDPGVRERTAWALAEIKRDPVTPKLAAPTPAPGQ